MSRAFVKEDDDARGEPLPEIQISSAPNLVTARGLRLIEAASPKPKPGSRPPPTRRRWPG